MNKSLKSMSPLTPVVDAGALPKGETVPVVVSGKVLNSLSYNTLKWVLETAVDSLSKGAAPCAIKVPVFVLPPAFYSEVGSSPTATTLESATLVFVRWHVQTNYKEGTEYYEFVFSVGDEEEAVLFKTNATEELDGEGVLSELARMLPGVHSPVPIEALPKENCCRERKSSLFKMVIHLNDAHKWSREDIANWLDELHDDGIINIEF